MSTTTKPTPGEVARAEAAEHYGHGRSATALANRRRRIYQLVLRAQTAAQIAETIGVPIRTVERDLAGLRREAELQVSTAELHQDAAEQLAEFAEQRAKILDALAIVGPEHRNYPRLVQAWIELTKVRHVFLERAGLRKPLDQGGPPDASDLRGKPTHVIEAEMFRISQAPYQRLDPRGYLKAVERRIGISIWGLGGSGVRVGRLRACSVGNRRRSCVQTSAWSPGIFNPERRLVRDGVCGDRA